MHLSRVSAALVLGTLVLLAGLLAGCGGSGGQSGGGSQDGPEGGSGQQQGGKAAKGNAPEVKIALGRVNAVMPDNSRIALGLNQEIEGKKRMVFKLKKKATVELDGKEAELSDAKKGQQAQIEYVVRNERNRARAVQLFAAGGEGDTKPSGGSEGTD